MKVGDNTLHCVMCISGEECGDKLEPPANNMHQSNHTFESAYSNPFAHYDTRDSLNDLDNVLRIIPPSTT